ncbi:MAG TPA: glycosyltransferase [Desulfatiglandales bacterium]|nr:glycosyltransferase [Desulfatiglandales bacterium]
MGAVFQHQQSHALERKGIKVGVVSAGFVPFKRQFSAYPYPSFEEDDGVNTYRCYKRILVPGRIANEVFLKYLVGLYLNLFERYINEQDMPDIIHAHNCLPAGVAALKIKEKYGIPYLITEHSSAYARDMISVRQAVLIREVLKNAAIKTAVSTKLGGMLENLFGTDASPIYPIFNILDNRFEKKGNILRATKKDRDIFTFLNIANLNANKNQSDLLEAFARVFRANGKVQLKIGGDGSLRRQLETQAKKLGLEGQIVFTGFLSRDRVLLEMRNCDVFVLSSIFETFGVVLIEALACGKPVIATKCGGPVDIVNPINGLIVSTKDIKALADAMSKIYLAIDKYVANPIRNDCLARFGEDAFVERLKNIYASILGKRKEDKK